jgi:flagellar motility protein MotE (MotC chaperone)
MLHDGRRVSAMLAALLALPILATGGPSLAEPGVEEHGMENARRAAAAHEPRGDGRAKPIAQQGAPTVDERRDERVKSDERAKARAQSAAVSDMQDYCANVASIAGPARIARQEKQLVDVEQQVKQRVAELEAKKLELQAMLDKRDELIRKTDETLVELYSRMKPDAAASQIANFEDDIAASLLMRLKPKYASAILSEMDAMRAASVGKKLASLSSLMRNEKKP